MIAVWILPIKMILLEAEVLELKVAIEGRAQGIVLDANKNEGLGIVATVLIQKGTLHIGDTFVCGNTYGKVRALINGKGKRIKVAKPADPVLVLGCSQLVKVSDELICMDLSNAKRISSDREQLKREQELRYKKRVTLDNLFEKIKEGQIKKLNVILKVDVSGSLEACADSLKKLSNDEVEIFIVNMGVGGINENDILYASTSESIIIGFNVRANMKARKLAEEENVEIRYYGIIFEMFDEMKRALEGLLAPEEKEVILGYAEVRQVFKVPKIGNIAGCYVTEGKILRNAKVRILRDDVIITKSNISSLRRIKDDAKEVTQGFECGIGVESYGNIQLKDVIECFEIQKVKRKLEVK